MVLLIAVGADAVERGGHRHVTRMLCVDRTGRSRVWSADEVADWLSENTHVIVSGPGLAVRHQKIVGVLRLPECGPCVRTYSDGAWGDDLLALPPIERSSDARI